MTGRFNLICAADVHIRTSVPRSLRRNFDVLGYSFSQLLSIMSIANSYGIKDVLIAGDLFHKPDALTFLDLMRLYYLFKSSGLNWYVIPGNHDVLNYNFDDYTDTNIGVLLFFGSVRLPNLFSWWSCNRKGEFYDEANILALHEFISPEPLPVDPGLYSLADDILNKYPEYNLIISGDNHMPFVHKKGSQTLINCGSLTKFAINQYYYNPAIWLINQDTGEYMKKKLPEIASPQEMFRYTPEEYAESKPNKSETAEVSYDDLLKFFDFNMSKIPTLDEILDRITIPDNIRERIMAWKP